MNDECERMNDECERMRNPYRIADAIVLANRLSTHRGLELEKGKVYKVPGYSCEVKATESLIELAKKIVRDWREGGKEREKECLPPSPSPLGGSDPNEEWTEGFKNGGGVNVVPDIGVKRNRQ